MYKNFIFDLYGTLVDIKTNESRKTFWEKLALFYSYNGAVYSYSELKRTYLKEVKEGLKANTKTKYPDIKLLSVFEKLYVNKGVKIEKGAVNQAMKLFRVLSLEYIRLYPGVIDLLEELKSKDKKIFMLSNGQREFTVPELRFLGIYDYFDGLYSSSDIEVCKPDKTFFDYLVEKEGLNRQETIFVGNDDKCDAEGAAASSLDCVYIHSNLSRNVTEVNSKYQIWDGDVNKIINYI
ncbi:HAD family hydrolase [Clostridium sp. YIM B02515]|uniref:HAD family hydrolase n=1 Tax=Clostridium rhizosphaerae TaxID=2803861 RepID=A0ABS1T513_9CLOT|nr:HAD family hydrolase [Clostridium rhizosphaerae]MBL4934428.1 HAD family hydrolase [Clostridium rhizosphaerae]